MANWTDISITVPLACLDAVCAIAQMAVPYGIYIEDYSDLENEVMEIAHIDLIDADLLKKDREHAIVHIYVSDAENPAEAVSFVRERMAAGGLEGEVKTGNVEEKDFATEWRKYYHPISISERLVVCPTWETYTPKDGEIVIRLDPGMAFGTGTHDTTRLCMRLIDRYLRPDSEVLDAGCGSGILAISALLLGARQADGCDIDALAVKVAAENAQINGVSDRARFTHADLTKGLDRTYDMICANIVADVIIHFLPAIPKHLKPGGVFIASGIVDIRSQEVEQAFAAHGFVIRDRLESGGWVCYAAGLGQ